MKSLRDLGRVVYEGAIQSKYNKDSLSSWWILVLMAILSGVSNKELNLAEKGISTDRNMTIGEMSLGFQ